MLDIAHLFIASAFAQDAAADAAAPSGPNAMLMNYLPFILIFGVFYLMVIRPQQKKTDEQNKMLKALQRGDRVVTSGGIHGKIVRVEGDDILIVEIADNVQVKMQRAHVLNLEAKTQPVTIDAEKK